MPLHVRSPAGQIDADVHRKIFTSAAVGMTFAAITTLARIALRIRRFWWDDGLALAALIFLLITAVSGGLYYDIKDGSKMPQTSRVALYYIFAVTFDLTIWISRLSLMANIIRMGKVYQKQLYTATAAFLVAMLILVSQVFWVCEPQDGHNHWKSDPVPQCILGKGVAITQITTDVFADIVLIVSPLVLLRYMRSNEIKMQKLRLGAFFIVGGFTSIVSIVHAIYLLQNTQISIVVSNAELSVSVIISNFALLVSAAYRTWLKYHIPKEVPEHSSIRFGAAPVQKSMQSRSSDDGEAVNTEDRSVEDVMEKGRN